MATIWERVQASMKAALNAWRGGDSYFELRAQSEGLSNAEQARLKKYNLLWKYYLGDHKSNLKVHTGQPDDNVIINHCERVIDDGVGFLFGKELRWDIEEGEETEDEQYLDAVWGGMEWRMSTLSDIAINGGVCGDFWIQLVPRDENQPDSLPRIINLCPQVVFPVCDPDDCEKLVAYQIRYMANGRLKRVIWSLQASDEMPSNIDYSGIDPGWVFWTEELKGARWEVMMPAQLWPWPWPNLIHGKNLPNPNSFFGRSDLESADLNDAINFTASNSQRILRLHAHPKPWGKLIGKTDLDIDPGKMPIFTNEKAELRYLEMTGHMQFPSEHLKRLTADFYKIARVPELDPDTMRLGAQSGFALRVLYSPLLSKTETKRRLYGKAIVECNRRLLDMAGREVKDVTLHWTDPLPIDEGAEVEQDKFELDYDLASRETIRARRGLDNETEMERMANEKTAEGNVGSAILKAFEQGQNAFQ